MTRLTFIPLAALLLAGCAVDLSDGADTSATYEGNVDPQPTTSMACETAQPEASAFDEGTWVLGISTEDPVAFTKLSAWVTYDVDSEQFAVMVQPRDLETDELVGEEQHLGDVTFDVNGQFIIDEVVLDLPAEAISTGEPEQTAIADVAGGFCVETGSVQGTFEGWTFTPTVTESGGSWFIAREMP